MRSSLLLRQETVSTKYGYMITENCLGVNPPRINFLQDYGARAHGYGYSFFFFYLLLLILPNKRFGAGKKIPCWGWHGKPFQQGKQGILLWCFIGFLRFLRETAHKQHTAWNGPYHGTDAPSQASGGISAVKRRLCCCLPLPSSQLWTLSFQAGQSR